MPEPLARVFLGSSAEGLEVARHLDVELGNTCEIVRWDQNAFEPSGYALDSLVRLANSVDFAVLIATPDDTTVSRDKATASPRDNIVLEFGLFAGALGRQRTFLLATGELKLPSDVLGLTRLRYRAHATGLATVSEAAIQVEERVRSLGRVLREAPGVVGSGSGRSVLERELDLLCTNAVAQGWAVRANSATTLRLRSPSGKPFALSKSQPGDTREQLRRFVAELRAGGLRVNNGIRRPVAESPL